MTLRRSILLFFITGVVFTLITFFKPIGDFGNYYYGSKLFVDGRFSIDDYESIQHFNEQIRTYGARDYFENYTPVPPFNLLFYIPFSFLDANLAKALFNLLGLIPCSFSLLRLTRFIGVQDEQKQTAYTWLPLIFLFPLFNNIYQGQSYLFITAFLIEAYIADSRNKFVLSSSLIALSCCLKLFPAFILFFFLIRKRFHTVLYSILLIVLASIVTIAFTGLPISLHYVSQVLPRLLNNDVIGAYYHSNQSIYTLLLHLFSYEAMHNPAPLLNLPWIVPVLESLLIAYTLTLLIGYKNNPAFLFGLVLLTGFFVNRYTTTYGMLLLLPLIAYLLISHPDNRYTHVLCFILFLALSIPIASLGKYGLVFQFSRLLGLLIIFIILLFVYKPLFHIRWFLTIFLPLLLVKMIGFSDTSPNYFGIQNSKGILYNCIVQHDSLVLISTLGHRDYKEVFKTNGRIRTCDSLYIDENRLFYNGKLIDNNTDNKEKPFLFNDSMAVFMSDLHQGILFYKLRMIPLK